MIARVGRRPVHQSKAIWRSLPVATLKESQIDIWSFNLRTEFQDEIDGPNGWTERRAGVAAFIEAGQPAVICVQEATEPMLAFLVDAFTPDQYGYVASSRTPGKVDEAAGFLYDRHQVTLLDHTVSWLNADGTPGRTGWDALFPRTFEAAVFELGSRFSVQGRIRLVNTHFSHIGVEAREQSAHVIAGAIATGKAQWPGCAQVVCGDFNSPKDGNAVYEVLSSNASGLRDATRVAEVRHVHPSTFHKFQGTEFDAVHGDGTVKFDTGAGQVRDDSRHIDWIFWCDGAELSLQPAEFTVVTDKMTSGSYPSDHFPVSVKFKLHSNVKQHSKL